MGSVRAFVPGGRTAVRIGVVAAVLIVIASVVFALEDTPENREEQAERYLQALPSKTIIDDYLEKVIVNLPEDKRDDFLGVFAEIVNKDTVTQFTKTLMTKHFTADELEALADFYGSPVGQSAMKKFGAYMADITPYLQSIMEKAVEAYQERELDTIK
jgi:hypothetical protein